MVSAQRSGRSAGRGCWARRDPQTVPLSRPAAGAQAGGLRSSGGTVARPVQHQLRRAALRPDEHLFRGGSAVSGRRQAPLRVLARSPAGLCADPHRPPPPRGQALVVTPEGLPLAYEVLPGNTADNTTLRDFLARIERQYGKARRIWLMDRGIPTEVVLAEMRGADPPVQYLVGTPKGRLTRLEKDILAKPWQQARPGVRVKLLPRDGELYVFADSANRVAKSLPRRMPGSGQCGDDS